MQTAIAGKISNITITHHDAPRGEHYWEVVAVSHRYGRANEPRIKEARLIGNITMRPESG